MFQNKYKFYLCLFLVFEIQILYNVSCLYSVTQLIVCKIYLSYYLHYHMHTRIYTTVQTSTFFKIKYTHTHSRYIHIGGLAFKLIFSFIINAFIQHISWPSNFNPSSYIFNLTVGSLSYGGFSNHIYSTFFFCNWYIIVLFNWFLYLELFSFL